MSVRVEEIRQENRMGDVSSADIEWLCRVAAAAETVVIESEVRGIGVVVSLDYFRRLERALASEGVRQ